MTHPLESSSTADAERHQLAWAAWPADGTTPVRAFLGLRGAGLRPCLLESVEGPLRLARYSFVAVDPIQRFRGRPGACRVSGPDGEEDLGGDTLAALRELARRTRASRPPQGLPPFRGGWIGFLTYEWASSLEPRVDLPQDDPWGLPEAVFDLYRDVVAFDHAAQRLIVLAACPNGASDHADAQARIERIAGALESEVEPSGALRLVDPEPRATVERGDFEASVARLQHEIGRGEIFQAVLSQRFEQRFEGDPFTLYRVLRLTNPSPHMFYFEAEGLAQQDDSLVLVGSSPERLVSVQDRRIQVVPIAGTRPRSADADEDERLAAELLSDPKERAEHDMLVDLARNDLGRVARIGTVEVKEHATLERFQRVMHLVSRVEGELASNHDALDSLAAAFPAGTVSGAPKVRAMELIAREEKQTRGPYAGAFGYLDGAGNLDVAISIRTAVVKDDTIHVQAGAGVVFDSVPEKEYMETRHKAHALLEAIQLADSPTFRPEGRK